MGPDRNQFGSFNAPRTDGLYPYRSEVAAMEGLPQASDGSRPSEGADATERKRQVEEGDETIESKEESEEVAESASSQNVLEGRADKRKTSRFRYNGTAATL